MNFYRRHWYHIGGILFVGLTYFMGFWGHDFSQLQVILIYSFMGMLAHQFEEYAFPGGLPGIANVIIGGEKKAPDRYPLNANQVLISNVFLTYPFYIIPILFPNVVWLGIMQVAQGMIQAPLHGIAMNVMLRKPYNPGMLSCLLIQLPLGLYYIWVVATQHLATTGDYILGSIAGLLSVFVLWLEPIAIFRSRKSKYPFTEAQMYGYAQENVKAMLRS